MTKSVSVAEAKARFSELVNRAAYAGERFLIERRGKPVGAIISAEDLARLEGEGPPPPRRSLLAAVGAWAEMENLDEIFAQIMRDRETRLDREVNLE
jgi:prevent-host-death family protein